MTFGGSTTLSLHPADALYVQKDTLGVPFKVANIGDPAGTITDDHLAGITGGFGALPVTTDITSTVTKGDRSRVGTTHVNVPSSGAQMTFSQHVANHDRVVDGIIAGSTDLSYTITGTDADGSAFEISYSDEIAADYDITYVSAYDAADIVYGLTSIQGVTVDDVTLTSVVSEDKSTYTITGVQQRRKGQWVKVGRHAPAVVKAGRTLRLRAVLTSPSGTSYASYSFAVPKKFHDQRGFLSVIGGGQLYSEAAYQPTVDTIAKAVAAQVRNDATQAELVMSSRRGALLKRLVSPATDKVVNGEQRVKVMVR
jgi:hypothetical protein